LSDHDLGSTRPGRIGALTRRAVAAAKKGDPEGIHYLYVRFGPKVRGYAMSFVREGADADEIVGRVFADLGATISAFDEERGPFDAWLDRRAHVAVLEHLRGRRPLRAEEVVLREGRRELLFYED
jgi:DNA-directed RNA polymerase specialized sigma24 family protein